VVWSIKEGQVLRAGREAGGKYEMGWKSLRHACIEFAFMEGLNTKYLGRDGNFFRGWLGGQVLGGISRSRNLHNL
jgi:hypothetical protein